MFEWLERKIHGKYIDEINRLNIDIAQRVNSYTKIKSELSIANNKNRKLHKDLALLRKDFGGLQDILENIEMKAVRYDVDIMDELQMRLHIVDKPYLEVVMAAMPVMIRPTDFNDPMTMNTKRIDLETMVGGLVIEDGFEKEASHELMVNIAKNCGKFIENKLLENAGWRLPFNNMYQQT